MEMRFAALDVAPMGLSMPHVTQSRASRPWLHDLAPSGPDSSCIIVASKGTVMRTLIRAAVPNKLESRPYCTPRRKSNSRR
jgi:hypothetical protein